MCRKRSGGEWTAVRRWRWLTLGAMVADPAGETLARTINGVAGAVVGAQTRLRARFAELPTGTHCAEEVKTESSNSLNILPLL